ncbi:hypothetical protein PUN28_002756 [Cardiocondyla obscurior]|uniref:Transmembrane protein n=1 Tax=Cardiocondyla obscurior TaxID=286306 RepID=A0AAW2GW33_9HYME
MLHATFTVFYLRRDTRRVTGAVHRCVYLPTFFYLFLLLFADLISVCLFLNYLIPIPRYILRYEFANSPSAVFTAERATDSEKAPRERKRFAPEKCPPPIFSLSLSCSLRPGEYSKLRELQEYRRLRVTARRFIAWEQRALSFLLRRRLLETCMSEYRPSLALPRR